MIARRAPFLVSEVADAVGAPRPSHPEGGAARALLGVATDTRDDLTDKLFVALAGDRFDAHDFLADAVQAGAAALLVGAAGYARVGRPALGVPVIVAQDTLRALGDLAHAHRGRRAATVLALTGSNGKTTTKEIAAAILRRAGEALATEGNLNNLIGLPLTLLGVDERHRAAVTEMGMNAPGEIARLTEIAAPDAGAVINVGPAHIGELGSMEAIAAAKGELFAGLSTDAVAVINLDDPRVVAEAARFGGARRRTFGARPGADVQLVSTTAQGEGQRLELSVDGRRLTATLPLLGEHNALNAAAAVALATARPDRLTVSDDQIVAGLAATEVPGARLKVRRIGEAVVIDDGYNANRASMEAALRAAAAYARGDDRRLFALLGEMRELGSFSADEHAQVGRTAAAERLAGVGAFGPDAAPLAEAAAAAGVDAAHEAEDDAALFAWLQARLQPGDVVVVKGSRGIRMERFVRRFEEAS